MKTTLNMRFFKIGVVLCTAVGLLLLAINFYFGRDEAFLMMNGDGGTLADYFFAFLTYFGDAFLWIPMLAYMIWKKKKLFLPLGVGSLLIVTLIVQGCKHYVVKHEPRPTKAIANGAYIHKVPGVEVHSVSSFPSGHTATAVVLFLMICLMTQKRWWIPVGFATAMLVGYSRIYLAQHFPLDVGAGILAGVIAISLSIPMQQWADRRRLKVTDEIKV